MQEITSIKNPKIQYVKKLRDKAFRRSERRLVAEGANLVCDLPSEIEVDSIFVLKSKIDEYRGIWSKYGEDKLIAVDEKVIGAISETVNPSGILAVVKYDRYEGSVEGNAVILDGVSDPGNMGTIIRTCAACGIKYILAVNCVDHTSPKVVRSSMSGIFKVKVRECNHDELFELLEGYGIYALDMGGENIFKTGNINRPFALAVGSESKGLSDRLKNVARIIALPMSGDIESLNAAVSLSVALYEFVYGNRLA